MSETNKVIFEKIIKYCDEIDNILKQIDYNEKKYIEQSIYQLSTDMCVYQIGELSIHISEDIKKMHLDIPWAQMRGMRNIHAHEYDKVNRHQMWNTLIDDIPILKEKISKLL